MGSRNMTAEQYEQINRNIQDTVEAAITRTVNGKIDKLRSELNTYVKEDNEWKDKVQPSIEVMQKIEGFSDTSLFLLKCIIALGAAGTVILGIIHYLKN